MRQTVMTVLLCFASALAAAAPPNGKDGPPAGYFDASGRADVLSGGARMIPIRTPAGDFRVWTKRTGNNPKIKVLLLHGGPGTTHEYLEAFDSWFPAAGIEYYYYDQLGSAYSDQPDDPQLLDIGRYVEEVEQVRQALQLDSGNFFLLGHSWGGLLAIEYALAYPQHLKGLVVSNMMSSIPAYNRYARDVLMPGLDPAALAEIQRMEAAGEHADPRYMQLLQPHYEQHVLRKPMMAWPEPVVRSFSRLNPKVYVPMQGPSELGVSGVLATWDRTADLGRIKVPTLVVGARHDTMDPEWMEMMSERLPNGRFLYCADGSHMALYDDQATYMEGVIGFLQDTAAANP